MTCLFELIMQGNLMTMWSLKVLLAHPMDLVGSVSPLLLLQATLSKSSRLIARRTPLLMGAENAWTAL